MRGDGQVTWEKTQFCAMVTGGQGDLRAEGYRVSSTDSPHLRDGSPVPLGLGASETEPGVLGQAGKKQAQSLLLLGPLWDAGPCPSLAICLCRNMEEPRSASSTGLTLTGSHFFTSLTS